MKYDKVRLASNIRFKLAEHGKKMSDLDAAIGKSTGYIAKTFSEDNTSNPSIDTVDSIASFLDTTISSLVYASYSKMTKNELFLDNLISKLLSNTIDGSLIWNRRTKGQILSSFTEDDITACFIKKSYYEDDTFPDLSYQSLAFPDQYVVFSGDVYDVDLNSRGAKLFIVYVEVPQDACIVDENVPAFAWHEMLIVNDNKLELLFHTGQNTAISLDENLRELYKTIGDTFGHVRLTQNTKVVLDDFISSITPF